ncbi:MAG: hypothetical protein RR346_03830 [Bacteroidales bacterium]
MQRYINTNLNFGSFFVCFFTVGISAYLLPNVSFTAACLLLIVIIGCFIFSLLVICFNHVKTNQMEDLIRESVDRKYTPYELIEKASENSYDREIESCVFMYERNGEFSANTFGSSIRVSALLKRWSEGNPVAERVFLETAVDIVAKNLNKNLNKEKSEPPSPKNISESELADLEIDKFLQRKKI